MLSVIKNDMNKNMGEFPQLFISIIYIDKNWVTKIPLQQRSFQSCWMNLTMGLPSSFRTSIKVSLKMAEWPNGLIGISDRHPVEWTPLKLYPKMMRMICRSTGRVFVGPAFHRDPEWIRMSENVSPPHRLLVTCF